MLLLWLLGCTGTVDLNLVLVDGVDLEVVSARAEVDQIVLSTCKGREEAVPLGYAFDLRTPTPVRVPDRRWCTAEVTYLATTRPLAMHGRTTLGTDFDVNVAPDRVRLDGFEVGGRGDELVLVLRADRMVSAAEIDALADDEGYARVRVDSQEAADAEVRLPGALELVTLGEALGDPTFPYPQDWFVERPPIETGWPAQDTGTFDTSLDYFYGDTGSYESGSGGCGSAASEDPEDTDSDGKPSEGSSGGCACGDDADSEADTADTAVASIAARSGSLAALLLFVRRRRRDGGLEAHRYERREMP